MNIRRLPWNFIADLLLALIPMTDANAMGYGWLAYVVYWGVLAVLLSGDRWAAGWQVWPKIGLKVAIVVASELAVSFGVIEVCNAAAADCHRVFSPLVLTVLVFATLIFIFAIRLEFSKTVRFNKLAMRHADLALSLFSHEPTCLIDPTPSQIDLSAYPRFPIILPTTMGHRSIYIRWEHLGEIQDRIGRQLKSAAPPPNLGLINLLRVKVKRVTRFGVFVEARKRGMTSSEAVALCHARYPFTAAEAAWADKLDERDQARSFARLIKELSVPVDVVTEFHAEMSNPGKRTRGDALGELVNLLATRQGIAEVLEHHGLRGAAAREKLMDLQVRLMANGAEMSVRLAAICYPILLHRLLQAEANGGFAKLVAMMESRIPRSGGAAAKTLWRQSAARIG